MHWVQITEIKEGVINLFSSKVGGHLVIPVYQTKYLEDLPIAIANRKCVRESKGSMQSAHVMMLMMMMIPK